MNATKSRKIIVASGMAVVLGIGVMTFALRPHPVTPIAPAVTPPVAFEQVPDVAPAAVAPTPDSLPAVAPAAAAPIAAAPVTPAHKDVTVIKPAVSRQSAKVDNSAVATRDTVTRIEPATTTSTNPTLAPTPMVEQTEVSGAQLAATDSQITTEVKTEIAADTLSKDVNIGVVTTNGVVALTGSLASQDAIDHVKELVARVSDVKSVDASALIVSNL